MKRLGFLTGAVLAGIGVFFFNQWRHVDDDDRILAILSDHCLPYVQTGETPFQTLGRAPGVYDTLGVDNTLADTGARLIYDLRFHAQWGVSSAQGYPIRVCKVSPTYSENTVPVLATNTDDFIARYSDLIPALEALTTQQLSLGGDLISLVWRTETAPLMELNVAVLGGRGQVSNVVVTAGFEAE